MTMSRPVVPQIDELICFSLKSKPTGSRYGALVRGSELSVSDQQLEPTRYILTPSLTCS
jgi:hypothetical protein